MRTPVVLAAVALAATIVPVRAAEESLASRGDANGVSARRPDPAVQPLTLAKPESDLSPELARRPVRVVYPSPYAAGGSARP